MNAHCDRASQWWDRVKRSISSSRRCSGDEEITQEKCADWDDDSRECALIVIESVERRDCAGEEKRAGYNGASNDYASSEYALNNGEW